MKPCRIIDALLQVRDITAVKYLLGQQRNCLWRLPFPLLTHNRSAETVIRRDW